MIFKILETSEFEKTQNYEKKVMSKELILHRHSEIVDVFSRLEEGNTAVIIVMEEDTTENYIAAFRRYWISFVKESKEVRTYSFKTLSDNMIAVSRISWFNRIKEEDFKINPNDFETVYPQLNKEIKEPIIISESAKGSGKSEFLKRVMERFETSEKLPEIWTEEEKFNRMKANLGLTHYTDGLPEVPKETKDRS
jgi:hypothetical protein